MASCFNHTKKFREGAETYANFELDVIKALLERLVSQKQIDSEKAEEHVVLARDWIQHVVEKAGSQQLSLEALKKELQQFVDDERLVLLLRYYQVFCKKLIAAQDRSPVVPLHLVDSSWRLDLQLAGSDLNKVIEPAAFLRFELEASTTKTYNTQDPSFTLEFSKPELYSFLCELDAIQTQLDEVS